MTTKRRSILWGAVPRLALALATLALLGASVPATAQAAAADTLAVETQTPESALNTVGLFVQDLFGLSTGNLQDKLLRIGVILLIVLIARVFLVAVQLISRWRVYAKRGPLKYVFRNHQRSITIHALAISLVKYVVYFLALGYVLRELGIDYKVYLASLSLVGIALGFGSQGLVQDVVTGFFILFENQFSVGDMVEISGQVGIVEAIGLRTTRIRNYFGASVVLQNRNIPMATQYPAGSYQTVVDVAIASPAAAAAASELLLQIGAEFGKQFREIILGDPRVEGLVELQTGELFVRLRVDIWPVQQWVIDAQLVPRIRELFKRDGIEVPADRVVVFYHVPKEATQSHGIVHAIRRSGEMAWRSGEEAFD